MLHHHFEVVGRVHGQREFVVQMFVVAVVVVQIGKICRSGQVTRAGNVTELVQLTTNDAD